MARPWAKEELDYLEEKWGVISLKSIAANLGRSVDAIKQKAMRMGMGDCKLHFDGITLNQLAIVLGIHYGTIKRWISDHDLPVKTKVFVSKRVLVIQYEDFWKWARDHKQLLNFSRLEPLILGIEPEWVQEKREADFQNHSKKKKRKWTHEDDLLLRSMVNSYQYTYPEIAKRLQRTEGAIKRRLIDLDIKGRPIRLNNLIKYTDKEVDLLVKLYLDGYGLNTIAKKLNKSALGVRGKLERMGYTFKEGIPIKSS